MLRSASSTSEERAGLEVEDDIQQSPAAAAAVSWLAGSDFSLLAKKS